MSVLQYSVTSDVMRAFADAWTAKAFPGATNAPTELIGVSNRGDYSKAAKTLGYTASGIGLAPPGTRKIIGQVLLAIELGECGDVIAERRGPSGFGPTARHVAEQADGVYRLCMRRKSGHGRKPCCWAVVHAGAMAIAMSPQKAMELCVRQHEAILGVDHFWHHEDLVEVLTKRK